MTDAYVDVGVPAVTVDVDDTTVAVNIGGGVAVEVGGVATVGSLPIQGARGPVGPAGAAGICDAISLSRVAATNLAGHRLVVPIGGGQVAYANADDPDDTGRPIWMTKGAAVAGAAVELLAFGEFTEPTWAWTPGPIYLSTDGGLTQTPPSEPGWFVLQVALSYSLPTTIFYDPKVPIALS